MKAEGGLIDHKDLAGIKANEDAPIKINYKGVEVYECPPNSQGFVMLQALNILEGMNVRYRRHNSAPYLHAVTESLKLAFADRNKYVADPKFTPNIPMREMLSKEYATIRRALIDPDKAIDGEAPFGNPTSTPTDSGGATVGKPRLAYAPPQVLPGTVITGEENGHTTYLAVVDKDRNMVSVTSSLLSIFGSGHVVKGAGFVLNNRMAYYGLDEDDVNVLKPGKRVRQTINPALALKDGKPYMVFGTPGADTQPQAQLQFSSTSRVWNERATSARAGLCRHDIVQELVLPARGRGNTSGSGTLPSTPRRAASMGHNSISATFAAWAR